MLQLLAEMSKTIAEVFVFVDFGLYCTEPDSLHEGLLKGKSSFVRRQLEVGSIFKGNFIKEVLNRVFMVCWYHPSLKELPVKPM